MKNLTEKMLEEYSIEELDLLKKNIGYYIVDIDINSINWYVLDSTSMNKFLNENYYKDGLNANWIIQDEIMPIGMYYLSNLSINNNLKYFIGVVKNTINKETIVGCIIYHDGLIINDKNELFTLIGTIEINYFYQGLGLLNRMLKNFLKIINKEQDVIMTNESNMGRICRVMNHLKKNFCDLGFKKNIYFEYEMDEIYSMKLCKSMKV